VTLTGVWVPDLLRGNTNSSLLCVLTNTSARGFMVVLVIVAVLLLQFAATLAALVDRHLDLGAVDIMLTMGPLALHHHHLHWPEAGLVRDAVIGLNIAGASTPLNHHMVWHNLDYVMVVFKILSQVHQASSWLTLRKGLEYILLCRCITLL